MTARPDLGLDGQPELVFQPAVDLATGRLLGFEALLRWRDPVLGPIPPGVLIPWAEANGHMTELTQWVLSEACSRAVRWRSDLQLAVNSSVFQLRERKTLEAAAVALEETGLNPDRLTIEITEKSIADAVAVEELVSMSELGIQLTVDDMGADCSSMQRLQQLLISTIKIDGALVEKIEEADSPNRAILETIIRASHSFGICAVAKGVETAAQVAVLQSLGADVGQGYFFAPPLAAEVAHTLATTDPRPMFALRAPSRAAGANGDKSSPIPPQPALPHPMSTATMIDALGAVRHTSGVGNGVGNGAGNSLAFVSAGFVTNDIILVSRRNRLPAQLRKGRHRATRTRRQAPGVSADEGSEHAPQAAAAPAPTAYAPAAPRPQRTGTPRCAGSRSKRSFPPRPNWRPCATDRGDGRRPSVRARGPVDATPSGWRVSPATKGSARRGRSGAVDVGGVDDGRRGGRHLVAPDPLDELTAAERHHAGNERRQRGGFHHDVDRLQLDLLLEDEHAEEAGDQRVDDREPRLGGGERPSLERVGRQQHRGGAHAHEHVGRPRAEDRAEAPARVGAELLDHRGDKAPRDARGHAQGGRPASRRRRRRRPGSRMYAAAATSTVRPNAETPANHHDAAGACRCPPEGSAVNRNTPSPAAMAPPASQSWRWTRFEPMSAM